ncbi:MAG: Toxin coregulated pilus biosynthesis protein E [Firmicutes bacterium]|nr:Toxin coregulated pilus biosynthesis protein E [Bacillota bacterium]MBT9165601.1 Toxin coregulated pilus biosynthesis protein E [Chloroflexota bacterium]
MWFGLARRAAFYTDMAAFLKAGLTPRDALTEMLAVCRKRKRLSNGIIVFGDVLRRMGEGESQLGQSMAEWIPPIEAGMINSGQSAGKLIDAFRELGENLSDQVRIRGIVVSKGIPIAFILLFAIGLMIFVLSTVVPQAAGLLPESIAAQMIVAPHYISIGGLILDWIVPAGIVGLGLTILIFMSLPRWRGAQRNKISRLVPPWTLYGWLQASFFLTSLAAMLNSGTTMKVALKEMARNSTPWQKWHLRKVIRNLEDGQKEVVALDTGMLPDDLIDRLQIYARLPNFQEVMSFMAKDSIKMFELKIVAMVATASVMILLGVALFLLTTFASLGEIAIGIEDAARAAQQGSGI